MDRKPTYEELEQRVTELKKEGWFRDLVENSLQGILIHRNHKPLFVNQAYADLLGYSPEEILNMDSVIPLFSLRDQERLIEYTRKRLKGEAVPAVYEYHGQHRGGSLIWLGNKVRVVQWKGAPAIQATVFDISHRKRTEEKLRESEERYRRVFEAASRSGQGAIIFQDRDNIEAACPFANDAAVHILGYTREELSRLSWFDILHSNCRDAARDRYIAKLSGKDIPGLFEITIIRKDGVEVPIELASIKTEFEGGGALVDFFRDITERKKKRRYS